MNNNYILTLTLLTFIAVAGCTALTGETGEFELLVSDQPSAIGDFDSLVVTFSEARVFQEDEAHEDEEANETHAEDDEHFETVSIDGRSVDLTEVTGARAESLLNTTLETGTYTKIELHADNVEGIVAGQQVNVMIPSDKLMITKNFEIVPNETTRFVFDIQVVERGLAGSYNLLPVISESGVAGKDVEIDNSPEETPPPFEPGDNQTDDNEPAPPVNGTPDDQNTSGDNQSNVLPASFTLESTDGEGCDTSSFFYDGEEVNEITIQSGVETTITFAPRADCTYSGGAEYYSDPDSVFGESDVVQGGETTSVTFTATQDFVIEQWWPDEAVYKTEVQVRVQ